MIGTLLTRLKRVEERYAAIPAPRGPQPMTLGELMAECPTFGMTYLAEFLFIRALGGRRDPMEAYMKEEVTPDTCREFIALLARLDEQCDGTRPKPSSGLLGRMVPEAEAFIVELESGPEPTDAARCLGA